MHTITTKIDDTTNDLLNNLSKEIHRSKAYIMQRALDNYLQEKTDILIALARIEKGEEVISFNELLKQSNELED